MTRLLIFLAPLLLLAACTATRTASTTESTPAPVDPYTDLAFLADDALRGRRVGSPGNDTAAAYIARAFTEAGARPLPGQDDLFVPVELDAWEAVEAASLSFDGVALDGSDGEDFAAALLPISRASADVAAPVVYLSPEELADVDAERVRGRAVVTLTGDGSGSADPRSLYAETLARRAALAEAGAAALVEAYVPAPNVPLARVAASLNQPTMRLRPAAGAAVPTVWIRADDRFRALREGAADAPATLQLSIAGAGREEVRGPNVIGVLPGTDPALADEHVLASAHFDHIGVSGTEGDTINNGARDNGMGTAALLAVARSWARSPGRRPLLLAAWNAEEVGLLGSEAFAAAPPLPLERVFFNFNMDGAGYTDTTAVVLNGYDFTNLQPVIDSAIAAVGLTPKPDPVPQYNLYRASDNWSLAKRGVPAINMAPGFDGFSEELMRYYHQPADEASEVDPAYLRRYTEAAVSAVRALSDLPAGVVVELTLGLE